MRECFKDLQPSEVVSREMTMPRHFLSREVCLLRTQHSFQDNDGSLKGSARLLKVMPNAKAVLAMV